MELSDRSVLGLAGVSEWNDASRRADERRIHAGWDWALGRNDGSRGLVDASFMFEFKDASLDDLKALVAEERIVQVQRQQCG